MRPRRFGAVFWLLLWIVAVTIWCAWFAPSAHSAELTWVDSCTKCELESGVEAYRLAATFPGHWLRFGLQGDSLFWRRGERIVLTLKDGSRVTSTLVLGVTPFDSHGRPIRLGIASQWLHQDALEQGHRGRGGLILAAFPDSAMTAQVKQVSLEAP